jgi:hypothetical protein
MTQKQANIAAVIAQLHPIQQLVLHKQAREQCVRHFANALKLAAEMRTYNLVGLQKAASVGINKSNRLKYAALAVCFHQEKEAAGLIGGLLARLAANPAINTAMTAGKSYLKRQASKAAPWVATAGGGALVGNHIGHGRGYESGYNTGADQASHETVQHLYRGLYDLIQQGKNSKTDLSKLVAKKPPVRAAATRTITPAVSPVSPPTAESVKPGLPPVPETSAAISVPKKASLFSF